MIKLMTILLALTIKNAVASTTWGASGHPLLEEYPCNDTNEILTRYDPDRPEAERNVYTVAIKAKIPISSKVELKFDSEANVTLTGNTAPDARITFWGDTFTINIIKTVEYLSFIVKGPARGTVPYFKSIMINTAEVCEVPRVGYLDRYINGYRNTAISQAIALKAPEGCGRRKVEHTELIVNGEATKAGDWPWHVAIYRLDKSSIKYICGGTLISKTIVLTAAHCATIRGVPVTPEILSVVLGKYNLIGGDIESQEREIHAVISHEDFEPKNYLENDIALLKLKSEATYNDHVQPACIWYSDADYRLPSDSVFGTVVGWGFDQSDTLSSQLKRADMPKVSDVTCIRKNPVFYANVLSNDKKFCAGWANGTSACNGDSGGGYLVFVPDTAKDNSTDAVGAWYIKGIVSLSVSRKDAALCDPNQYVIFTDVAKYIDWIKKHLAS